MSELSSLHSAIWGNQEEGSHQNPIRNALTFWPPEPGEYQFLLFKPSVCGIFAIAAPTD